MNLKLGIVAEDQSDVDVVEILLRKMARREFLVRSFASKGSGKLKADLMKWAGNLCMQGCNRLLVLHDLDNEDGNLLKQLLEEKIHNCKILIKAVVIPVREIEAWLLADEAAIKTALKLKRPIKRAANTEALIDPKKAIDVAVAKASDGGKQYIHTIHNSRIASHCSVEKLNKCKSFQDLRNFAEARL
jgi:hypothetical protein